MRPNLWSMGTKIEIYSAGTRDFARIAGLTDNPIMKKIDQSEKQNFVRKYSSYFSFELSPSINWQGTSATIIDKLNRLKCFPLMVMIVPPLIGKINGSMV